MRNGVSLILSLVFLEFAIAKADTSVYSIDTLPQNFLLLDTKESDGVKLTEINLKEVVIIIVKYVEKFKLPVHMGETVNHLSRTESEFEINTSKGILKCNKVIVATGTNPLPRIPVFAKDLDKNIHQIPSSQYLNPDQKSSKDTLCQHLRY